MASSPNGKHEPVFMRAVVGLNADGVSSGEVIWVNDSQTMEQAISQLLDGGFTKVAIYDAVSVKGMVTKKEVLWQRAGKVT